MPNDPNHPKKPEEMVVYAWIGVDDSPTHRSDDFGIKQGVCAAGNIPLVSCRDDRLMRPEFVEQMQFITNETGQKRFLAKFVFQEIVHTIEPGTPAKRYPVEL